MRKGQNPQKNNQKIEIDSVHQVVIPVHIPNEEGYFADGLDILKCCLTSLLKTVHDKTFITIVNNGSCKQVSSYLDDLFAHGHIDELIHTANIGKINSVIKGLKGHSFELVTIADADVLFLSGWQKATYDVFNAFPKVGVVGLVPQFKLYADLSSNVLFDFFWSKKMAFRAVKDPEAMRNFYQSIGWKSDYNQDYLKVHLTLSTAQGMEAVVGSGHFVATYRGDVLNQSPSEYYSYKMGSALRHYFDAPVLKSGGYRLTTDMNFAYHMGNVLESWMHDTLKRLDNFQGDIPSFQFKHLKNNRLSDFIKNHLFRKLLEYKPFMNWFIKFKGLPKTMCKTPWHE
ncbi:MAG: glycosyltransferase family A protein [Flavobacteriaceae bacterium]